MPNVVSRLSRVQKDILAFLATVPPPSTEDLTAWPTTGDVIEAIGRERNNSNYASVSRALARLADRGLVEAWSSFGHIQGKGHRYRLAKPPH